MKALNEAINRRQQAEKQERVERIMNAARQSFLEKGYLGTKIRDIALGAELSPGLIYFYFKGKDEIYGNICKEAFHILLDLLKDAAKASGTASEKLKAIADAYLKFYTDYNDYFDIISFRDMGFKKVGLSKELQQELNLLSNEVLSMYRGVVEDAVVEAGIKTDIDSWKITFALWGTIEGSFHIHKRGYFDAFNLNLEDVVRLQMEIIKKGLILT